MNRPYVICHMLQSIDGKIAGGFFREKETTKLAKIYKWNFYKLWWWCYHLLEKQQRFELFSLTHLNKSSNITYNLTDHVYQKENKKWLVVIDLKGEIAWDSSIYKIEDYKMKILLSYFQRLFLINTLNY